VRGEGSRGGWRHKEGECGFWGDSHSFRVFTRGDFGGSLGGTDLAVGIYHAHRG
jgi:hypothetical protein